MAKKKPQAAYLGEQQDLNFDAGEAFLATLRAPAQPAELENRGALRGMADVALAGGRGAVQGVRMLTDLAGSDNAASRTLRSVEDYISGLRSAQAQQDDQAAAAIMKAAENAGILDQVIAGAKAFAQAPISTLAQAVGTSVPTIAAAMIPGAGPAAAAGRMATALGMGAAQGAGSVKGQIYDEVKQELLQAGASPAEAERRALEASSYAQSGGKIATGAALGALAGTTGMEHAVGALARGVSKEAPGMARRVLTHGTTEAIPEAAQGAQEKLASNQALYEQGFDVAPGAGVVAAGTMEGLAGFGMGAAAGVPRPAVRPGDQLRIEGLQPERGPATRALNAAVEAAAKMVDAGAPMPSDPALAAAGDTLRAAAGVAAPQPVLQPVEPVDLEQIPSVEPAPAVEPVRMSEPGAIAQREADRPAEPKGEPQAGDILNSQGKPFRNQTAALRALEKAGGESAAEIAVVKGGWVIRPRAQEGAVTDAAAAGGPAVEQPADAGRSDGTGGVRDSGPANLQDGAPAPADQVRAGDGAADVRPGGVGPAPELTHAAVEPATAEAQAAEAPAPAAPAAAPAADVPGARAGAVEADGLTGPKIDDEWTAFAPESGTKGVPRAEMPQIKAGDRSSLVQFLRARGIDYQADIEVPADQLKPTQAEFSPGKVAKAQEFTGGDRSILVSSDGHVLDGHHQWVAKRQAGEPVKVIRLDAPIDKLLAEVREFPSAQAAEGAAVASDATDQALVKQTASDQTWDAMPATDRLPVLVRAGWSEGSKSTERMLKLPWSKMSDSQRTRVGAALGVEPAQDHGAGEVVATSAKSSDQRTAAPVAESQAPAPSEPGDGGVAPTLAGSAPNPTKAKGSKKAAEIKAKREAKKLSQADTSDLAAEARQATHQDPGEAPETAAKEAAQPAVASEALEAEQPAAVENFGEQLPPARRTMAAKLTEGLADDDIAKRPLSEIWPLAENEAIEDTFPAAVAHAARAEIPAKPRQPYKLRQWVEKVKILRGLAGRIVSGEVSRERMAGLIDTQFRSLRDWWSKVQLLEQTQRDQWKRVGSVEERPDAITYEDGKQVSVPMLRVEIDGKSRWLTGDHGVSGEARGTVDGNRAGILALLAADEPLQRMKFEIRRVDRTGEVFINKEGDPERRRLMTFAAVEEARTAIAEQYDALVGAWEAVKARDNITERDLRRADNRPRVGADHRGGKDVTVDEFQERFGFRGGEFGAWVKQGKGDKERQALLNGTYDALMDLAGLLNVPPRAMSLNGTLGIALGSRGSGWASAHFEPSNLVINLTKTRGAGTLAHEWFHALDNYFSRMRRDGAEAPFTGNQTKYRDENYITHRPEAMMVRKDRARGFQPLTQGQLEARRDRHKNGTRTGWPAPDAYDADKWERDPSTPEMVRPEVEARFAALVAALKDSPMAKRAALLDKGGGYWSRTLELAARAFESYVIARMHEQGYHNDFLVNVTKSDEMGGKDLDRYPYLLAGEVKPIAEAFDALFAEVKTRTDDAGNVAMFSRDAPIEGKSVDLASAKKMASDLEASGLVKLNVVQSTSELPATLLAQLSKTTKDGRVRGAYIPSIDEVWLVADHIRGANEFVEVALHEAFHRGLGKLIPESKLVLREIWRTNQSVRKLTAEQMRVHGIERDEAIEEALAKRAEAGTVRDLKGWPKLLETIRSWLAKVAQAVGIEMTWTDDMVADLVAASTREGLLAGVHFDAGQEKLAASRAPTVMRELAENDDLFALPRLSGKNVSEIAFDLDPAIKVLKRSSQGLRETWRVTLPEGGYGDITIRKPNPHGPDVYGFDLRDGEMANVVTERAGENPNEVDPTDDVWIDVSTLKTGQGGNKIYAIAGALAHNTGRIFIGDPNGLSPIAMRRRAENMLSLALRYGTTKFLAPHPDQTKGSKEDGVPPLRWVYGDDEGNAERLIALNIKAVENSGPDFAKWTYDVSAGRFHHHDAHGVGPHDDGLHGATGPRFSPPGNRGGARADGQGDGSASPGSRTLARAVVLRALSRQEGGQGEGGRGRDGLLARLAGLAGSDTTNRQLRGLFSRVEPAEDADASMPKGVDATLSAIDALQRMVSPQERIAGQTARQYTEAQRKAMQNVGFEVEPTAASERLKSLWSGAAKKLAQGIVDQFAPVKELSERAYMLLRLSKGASGAFETLLQGGKLKLTDDTYDFDEAQRGGVIDKLLKPLQGEHHDFLRWVAANRAERLKGLGKENLFSAEDIAGLKSLANGVSDFDYRIQTGAQAGTVTRDRTLIYADALRVFNGFQKNVLDMAEQSGLIDGEARGLWEQEFYVPFYRVEDDGSVAGANIKSGVVRQQAFKSLTGRTNKLNADLLENTLMNWAHLIDAAAKNRGAKAAIEAAEAAGVALAIDGSQGKGSVWFMENGEKRWSFIDDPHVMTAITALQYAGLKGPAMKVLGGLKHALTVGVTASPFFKVRNLIRDSVQVIATSPIGVNPLANVKQGWNLSDPSSDSYFRLLAGGGTIHFGSMIEGSEAKRVQALVDAGVDASTILDGDEKVKAFYRKVIKPGIDAYNALGNRGEAVNRAALYQQLIGQGVSHAEASLQARDLMDFSMQGSFASIRFLTQVVPFFNARLQGLYKLGRAAKTDPKRMAYVIGAAALVSLALLAAYGDDDDWKKREEWDRQNYWWFKIGGLAYRIPKPFEIGAVATLAERSAEYLMDQEMTGKRFRAQLLSLLADNLSMSPIPQAVRPMLDVYANKDAFSGRPIETMGMEKLKPEYRARADTSMAARAISTTANAVTGIVGADTLSPVQIDHLIRGYFGWLGTFVASAADMVARPLTDQPDRPAPDYWKRATGSMISRLDDAPSRYVSQVYDQAKALEQAYGTWRQLVKEGRTEEASQFKAENEAKIVSHKLIERMKQRMSVLNAQAKAIELDLNTDGDAKREALRAIRAEQDALARRVPAI